MTGGPSCAAGLELNGAAAPGEARSAVTAPLCVNPLCRKPLRKRSDRPSFAHVGGMCMGCHHRGERAGWAQTWPAPPMTLAEVTSLGGRVTAARNKQAKHARLMEFARLRARRVPLAAAARRVGVSLDTGRRYEAELRGGAEELAA